MHIYSKYVHKCQKRPFTKAQRPKKDLDPSKSHPFEVGLSGPSHFEQTDQQIVLYSAQSVDPYTQNYVRLHNLITKVIL